MRYDASVFNAAVALVSPVCVQTKVVPYMQWKRPQFDSWVEKICWRRDRLPIPVFLGFPCGSAGKESTRNVGDLGSVPGSGRSPGEGKGYLRQYSGLENSVDCIVHEGSKSWTRLSGFHFHFACFQSYRF